MDYQLYTRQRYRWWDNCTFMDCELQTPLEVKLQKELQKGVVASLELCYKEGAGKSHIFRRM